MVQGVAVPRDDASPRDLGGLRLSEVELPMGKCSMVTVVLGVWGV